MVPHKTKASGTSTPARSGVYVTQVALPVQPGKMKPSRISDDESPEIATKNIYEGSTAGRCWAIQSWTLDTAHWRAPGRASF